MMHNYKELLVWRKSMDMVVMIYQLMEAMPDTERFGLTQQIKRAAVSVPSNIAEGAARSSNKEFIRFLYFSNGSIAELLTQLELATSLGFVTNEQVTPIAERILELQKMTYGLMKRMKE